MKKGVLILLLVVLSISKTNAQNYFPKGAIWYYHSMDWSSSSFSYTTLTSKGDTIFNGDTLTYLEGSVGCAAGWDELLKQVGQKIYKLNKCDSTYSLLYDFGANVGDTITTYPNICFFSSPAIILIDSINPININGNILTHFYFTQLNPYVGWFSSYTGLGSIIEGIGNTDSFYPYLGGCDPWGGPLRCYHDTIIGEYNSGLFNGVCDTVYVGINENTPDYSVSIFPNPTKNTIRINSDSKIETITVYDIRGVKLLATKESIIDLSTLSKGIYFLKIRLEQGVINRKILKE